GSPRGRRCSARSTASTVPRSTRHRCRCGRCSPRRRSRSARADAGVRPSGLNSHCDRLVFAVVLDSEVVNYFFEWITWLGFAIYGLAFAPWGLIALLGQVIILGSILKVTGIPPMENQAIRSQGDAYRSYQARVSRFIPLPPKRSRATPVRS